MAYESRRCWWLPLGEKLRAATRTYIPSQLPCQGEIFCVIRIPISTSSSAQTQRTMIPRAKRSPLAVFTASGLKRVGFIPCLQNPTANNRSWGHRQNHRDRHRLRWVRIFDNVDLSDVSSHRQGACVDTNGFVRGRVATSVTGGRDAEPVATLARGGDWRVANSGAGA